MEGQTAVRRSCNHPAVRWQGAGKGESLARAAEGSRFGRVGVGSGVQSETSARQANRDIPKAHR